MADLLIRGGAILDGTCALPGGGTRLTRAPGGYRYTIVNGVVVQEYGTATDALPAGWVPRPSGKAWT